MSRRISAWIAEAAAVFAKDARCELRTPSALAAVALFALTTLVVVSLGLGPVGAAAAEGAGVLPALLWIVLLFAAAAGLPRGFAREEESHTATALRLAATPSALYCGKLAFNTALLLAIDALVGPLFLALLQLEVRSPGDLAVALLVGGYGLAAGSTLIAAIVAQTRGSGPLFAVLSFPILVPLLLLAIELTRGAVEGVPPDGVLRQIVLYDGAVTVAGFLLFPAVWHA
jgi:heme exporter protein B